MPQQDQDRTGAVAVAKQTPSFHGLEWTTSGSFSRTVARLIPQSIATKFSPPTANSKRWQGGERIAIVSGEKPRFRRCFSSQPSTKFSITNDEDDDDQMMATVTMRNSSDLIIRHDSLFSDEDNKSMLSEAVSSFNKTRRSSSIVSQISSSTLSSSSSSSRSSSESIAFWNVNVPLDQHTETCPDFLTYAFENHKDRGILSTPDWQFRRKSWPQVVDLVHKNELFNFERVPSDLRMYKQYCGKLAQEYGSIMKFIMQERLQWENLDYSGAVPFTNSHDFKILRNDWPYGIDPRIIHLVVWVRFDLPTDPDSSIGDMSPATRAMLESYVTETFRRRCGSENVLWFKNWNALKSVHAVEHFHVMLFDPEPEFVAEMTGGDVPLQEKLRMTEETEGKGV